MIQMFLWIVWVQLQDPSVRAEYNAGGFGVQYCHYEQTQITRTTQNPYAIETGQQQVRVGAETPKPPQHWGHEPHLDDGWRHYGLWLVFGDWTGY